MANVLSLYGATDLDLLQRLSDDLEEILLSIAYNGKSCDIRYIRATQKFLRRKYGSIVESWATDVTTNPYLATSGIGIAVSSVVSAYDGLLGILFLKQIPEDSHKIEDDAMNLVFEYLILPDDMDTRAIRRTI
jgi:hypothetical protein